MPDDAKIEPFEERRQAPYDDTQFVRRMPEAFDDPEFRHGWSRLFDLIRQDDKERIEREKAEIKQAVLDDIENAKSEKKASKDKARHDILDIAKAVIAIPAALDIIVQVIDALLKYFLNK